MQQHRLAAIMFTDIVGYTALMGKDEEKAFAVLEKNRQIWSTLRPEVLEKASTFRQAPKTSKSYSNILKKKNQAAWKCHIRG